MKIRKSPMSKMKKRILTAAGIFTAGSVFGASITEPPSKTVNVSSSLLDSLSEQEREQWTETKETLAEETVQSLLNSETVVETETENNSVNSVIRDTEISESLPETIPEIPEDTPDANADWFVIDAPVLDWDVWEVVDETEAKVDENWFTEQATEYTPESPVYEDWMEEKETVAESELPVEVFLEDTSMSSKLIAQLEGVAFFWAPSGEKVHINPTCRSFKKGYTFAGTLEEAQSVRTEGWCGICSKDVNPLYNSYATAEVLAECYSYGDFIAGIPVEAFKDN